MRLPRQRFGLGIALAIGLCAQVVGVKDAHAGAWDRPQWGYFIQLGTAFTSADELYQGSGTRTGMLAAKSNPKPSLGINGYSGTDPNFCTNCNGSQYSQLLSDLYFEVGLLRRLTVFGDISYVSARQGNDGGQITYASHGVGDLMFGARTAILEKPVAFALEGRIYIPTGDSSPGCSTPATATGPMNCGVAVGPGDFRGDLRLALGKSWRDLKLPLYVELEVGVTFRGTASRHDFSDPAGNMSYTSTFHPSDEVFVHGEIGGTIVKTKGIDRLILGINVDYRTSTSRDTNMAFTLTPETMEYTSLGATLIGYLYRGFGLSLRYNYLVEGRNVIRGGTVGGALFASF